MWWKRTVLRATSAIRIPTSSPPHRVSANSSTGSAAFRAQPEHHHATWGAGAHYDATNCCHRRRGWTGRLHSSSPGSSRLRTPAVEKPRWSCTSSGETVRARQLKPPPGTSSVRSYHASERVQPGPPRERSRRPSCFGKTGTVRIRTSTTGSGQARRCGNVGLRLNVRPEYRSRGSPQQVSLHGPLTGIRIAATSLCF